MRLRENGGDPEAIAWRIVEGLYDDIEGAAGQGSEAREVSGQDREGDGIPGFEPRAEGEGPTGLAPRGSTSTGSTEGGRVELTPEGQQYVISGAERITDRERAEREQQRPKRGGDAAPAAGELFDVDARN